jgi:hypothetical protein
MKTYKVKQHILAIVIFLNMLISFNSCQSDLNTAPLNAPSTAMFWIDEASAKQVLMGVYQGSTGGSKGWGFTTYSGTFWMDLASDNAVNVLGINTDYCNLTNGNLSASNAIVTNFWAGAYNKIMLANDFLTNIALMTPASISDASKARMTAEARFLRAIEYFYLCQFYGRVPLVTKLLSVDDANNVKKAAAGEVEDFVASELTAAAAGLPSFAAITGADRGRACKQAALAYLGRLQLSQKKYAEASATYKKIVDAAENKLATNFETLFTTDKFSSENIYSLQFISGASYAGNTSDLPLHCLPAANSGQVGIDPYESLASSYDFNDGTPFSYSDPRYKPDNLANQRDPRFAFTILYPGATLGGKKYVSSPDSVKSKDRVSASGVLQATKTGYCMRKYLPADGIMVTNYGGNIPLIRYAEVLLSYLEAELEGSGTIDQTLLDNTINKVRGRTGVNMPRITVTDKTALRPILRKERRIELALEGIRLWDLKRWGIAAQTLKGDFWGSPFPGTKTNLNLTTVIANPNRLWYVGKLDFQAGQEMWPIPETEQNINPNLR